MPGLFRMLLGLLLLLVTVGLTTCQSMLKAEPVTHPSARFTDDSI